MEQPVVTLATTRVQAEPGGQVQLSVTVKNPGHLVESFRLDVVGLDRTWWQVHPPELPVYPGQEGSAVVVLSPPVLAEAPEQALPFGVRAVSTLDAGRSAVEEGDLEVGRILDLQAGIEPVTSRGRWRGQHRITYTNWGNTTVHLRLSVIDKDQQLGFRLRPEQVSVPIGGSASARLQVRPQKPFLRGVPRRLPFQVIGESGTSGPIGLPRSAAARAGVAQPGRPVLDGALQQKPVLSRGVVVLAGLMALLALALAALAIRLGQVEGATQDDVAPGAPTGLQVEGAAADLMDLTWAPTDRALGYQVWQVDGKTDLPVQRYPIAPGLTGFQDKGLEPLTRRCYVVVAVRGERLSRPGSKACATTPDGSLPVPKDVAATPVGVGYVVSWVGDQRNDHVILLDGAPVGGPIPAGQPNATIAAAPGRHCLGVVAKRGEQKSSVPSPPVCLESGAVAAPATPGAGDGGGGVVVADPGGPSGAPGTPTASAAPEPSADPGAGDVLVDWVAVFGTYQEQARAQLFLQRARAAGFTSARILTLPHPQIPDQVRGLLVVVDKLPDEDSAKRVCATVAPDNDTPCDTLFANP